MRINLNIKSNLGYSHDQIDRPMSLGQLLEAVEEAVEQYGEDAQVAIRQVNNRYGANYGHLYGGDPFSPEDEDSDDY